MVYYLQSILLTAQQKHFKPMYSDFPHNDTFCPSVFRCLIISITKILGGLGQLGTGLAKLLRTQYGTDNIILSDIIRPKKDILENGK